MCWFGEIIWCVKKEHKIEWKMVWRRNESILNSQKGKEMRQWTYKNKSCTYIRYVSGRYIWNSWTKGKLGNSGGIKDFGGPYKETVICELLIVIHSFLPCFKMSMSTTELRATKYCEESVKSEPEKEQKHNEDSYEEDKRDFTRLKFVSIKSSLAI